MSAAKKFTKANVWVSLRDEATNVVRQEPCLAGLMRSRILDRRNFGDALAMTLAQRLAANPEGGVDQETLYAVFTAAYAKFPVLVDHAKQDLVAVMDRDPAATEIRTPFLYFKGYHTIAVHRLAHYFWKHKRRDLALYLQSMCSERFAVDIHPNVPFGARIMIDHATGIVIGETAVVGDDVSMLHAVTLGGTGKEGQDRHPKIGNGVLLGAGAKVLGNIMVDDGSRVAAGSVVLKPVPSRKTVAGVPAKVVGNAGCASPGKLMDQVPEIPETPLGQKRPLGAVR